MGRKNDESTSFRPSEPAAPTATDDEPLDLSSADAVQSGTTDEELVLGQDKMVPAAPAAPPPYAPAPTQAAPAPAPVQPPVQAQPAPQPTARTPQAPAYQAPPRSYADDRYAAPTPAAPAPMPAADEGGARRRWLAPGAEAAPEAATPATPRVKLGGTLFERMSNAARGAAKEDGEAAPTDPLDIPRFLHRQNNQ